MRIKGRKYISLVLMLMFLVSFFPGYSLAGETDGQGLLPANEIIQSDLNNPGIADELPAEPDLDDPDQPSTDPLANEPGDAAEGNHGQNTGQAATPVPGAYILVVKHVLQSQDGQIFENEEIIPDVQLGSVVSGIDYLVQDLPEGISFMDSNPELLTIQAGDNLITLNYQELPWLEEEELPEGIEESPGQLGEDEMEPYFSDIRLDFSSLSAPVSKGARMMMRSAPNTTVLQPGEVQAVKTAEWEDYENRIAKIALNVVGEPVLIGADVVLVVDNSGSMGNNSGKVEDHTGTIESPQLINDETSTNIWGTKQTQTRTYSGICQECGKTVTYTSERTRTRPAAWNDWGPWSDWSTPNTTHSVYRIDIAKQASASFVGTVLGDGNPAGNQVALVTFSSSGNSNHLQGVDFQTTVAALAPSINAMNAVGGTNYTDALTKAKSYLDARSDTTRPAYVVFVSDGAPGQSGNSPNDPDWNGINQANALKEAGVTIYSVGIALSQDNAAALTALATVENGVPLYKNVVNVGDLTAVLNKIGGAIQNAGTAALMTDEINIAHFELLSGTPGYLLPEGVTIDNSGGQVKVNWNIGAITKTPQEIVLYVKLKDEYASTGNSYLTNADVNLTYKDTENQPQTKVKEEIGDPSVVVNHIVTFIAGTNGNLATGDQTVFSNILDGTLWDDAVNLPDTEPDPGYKFDSWSPDFPATVTESATYTANFIPADDTAYKVEHYQQDLGATTYTLAETVDMTGTTGENTAAAAKVYPGFTAQSFSQEVIAGDGSTVVKIYYDRNGYTVTWVDEDGTELEKDEDVLYGTTPSYDGAVPSKPATAEFTYSFNGWTPAISPVTGDAIYTATYSAVTNGYTVTWVDEDGTELEKDEDVLYGTTPSYDGAVPSKPATAEFTYSFNGWTPAISPVTGDAIYTATYSAVTNGYTVTWVDEDGTELEKDEDVLYGTTPSYDGAVPSKPATAEFTYSFNGWTPAISPVTGDVIYTATYSAVTNGYTVTWVDEDGTELEKDEDVLYGTTPSYDGAVPSKPATAEFTYSFNGWTPAISPVTGDAIYTATYSAVTNGYTVTWVDEDGTELEKDEDVLYGTTPSYDGAVPSKPATAEFTYSFNGWTPAISPVTGDAIYTATYSAVTNGYTVTWVDEDGTELEKDEDVLYGTTPSYDGAVPSKPATAEFTYSFNGWTPAISPVTGDAIYTATYSAVTNGYTVTWVDEDGTELEKDEDVLYGTTPSYDGAVPSKPATAEFTYSFSGWTPAISPVTGDAIYTATYSAVTNGYTVTWVDEDGTELEKDEDVLYGTTPSYDGAVPSKPATAEFTYSFSGWTPAISPVTGDAIYTATYSAVTNGYTVTWVDEDGTELEKDEDVLYGTTPSYDGAVPSKPATAEFTYSFNGWTPAISPVTGDAIYTATYSAVTNGYTVTWVDEDGTELEKDEDVLYGTTPSYDGAVPSKPATAEFTYSFNGWTPAISPVTGDAIYTATYSAVTNGYTVTWVDEDGTELEKDEDVLYGTTPSYDGAVPSKPATAEFTYSFNGWTPAISPVTGDAIYTATYSAVTNGYTVTWVDEDGTELEKDEDVLYGTTPSYDGAVPSKPATAEFTYSFNGWTPAISPVTGDAIYTATYSAVTNGYTVTWVDEDGTELEKDEDVLYGTTPSYDGAVPSKPATAEFTYSFNGWTPAISPVTGDAIYTATYSAVTNGYTVTWVDEDGTELEKDEDVLYGTTPSYDGAVPSKPATAEFTYSFNGWTPAISPVTGDAIYTATYSAVTNGYTVTWVDEDGTELEKDEDVLYGTTPSYDGAVPSKPATAEFTYSFNGWTPAISPVTGDAIYTATYSAVTNGYTVTWVDEDGTELEKDEDVLYGTTPSYDGAVPSKPATAEFTYSFNGWTPAISPVTGDVIYTATYSAVTNGYTVTWVDEDGTELEKDEDVLYGTTPSYDGAVPSKPATAEFTYSFNGWTPAISPVTGDAIYTATYSAVTNGYTVTWVDEDGTELEKDEDVLYGTTPSYDGAVPSKPATAEFTYSFNGWTPAISPVTGDAIYTATYSAVTNGYTVTWVDEDGTELEKDEDVLYGTTPSYDGAVPSKPATAEFTYSFNGWTPAISPVTGDAIYTATYSAVTNGYTVTWVDEDGTELEKDEDVLYGTTPSYDGAVPSKPATAEFTYSFNGWTPAISPVTGDAIYTATYSAVTNSYTVTYKITGNYFTDDEYATQIYEYGASVTAAATPSKSGYIFHGWTGVPETMPANDVTVTGYYTKSGGGGGGPSGPGGSTEPEEPIEVPEEPEVAIPLNKDDHFAYVVGYPDNTVQPVGNITREEVAAVFYRLLDPGYRETIKTTSNDFPDVGLDRWSSKHVGTLASVDIIIGYPDGTFRPGNSITRAELATIASKFDKLSPFTGNSFSDIEGHWANEYINSAAQKGWVAGYPDGTYKPDQAITRAEFMTLVNKVLERRVLKEDILPDARQFPDLSPDEWYYVEVQEAINSHHYERATRQDYEIWTDIYYPELDM